MERDLRRLPLLCLVLSFALASLHCGSGDDWTPADQKHAIAGAEVPVRTSLTYLKDVQPIFDARCIACRRFD